MCLAVPVRLLSLDQHEGAVELHGTTLRISTMLVPDAVPGDWLLVHAGFAIQRLNESEVRQTWSVLEDLRRAQADRLQALPGDQP